MAAPRISPAAVGGLARVLIGGGLAVYGAANSLFNVEGGHRAIVFNRLVGIKDEVSLHATADSTLTTNPVVSCNTGKSSRCWVAPEAGQVALEQQQ